MARLTKTEEVSTPPAPELTVATEPARLSSIVKPIMRSNGERHILEDIFDDHETTPKELPILTATGCAKMKGLGPHGWVSYVIKTQGCFVLSIEVAEPDMKMIAVDAARTSFVEEFMDKDVE